ncbi:TIGR03084 family metal-binding protein [Hydrogenophaga sp. ZJX-1]|uniref:TIGR03084 family metal-binding protein n=1 Tax=Hydrogenophaga sp. ZJX-1 TaxID=3404778 RepID=UPI003B28B096
MRETCRDLLDEYRALADLCATLGPEDWRRETTFYGWTPWDEVAHLCYFDQTALQSVNDPETFIADAKVLGRLMADGGQISAVARETFGGLDGPALLERWRGAFEPLVAALARQDPRARLNWYGPTMSARSFATARLMETWAHGQDIWDVMRRPRPGSARLKAIAHIGVSTFGWTFVNRQLPVPGVQPFVELTAPDGSVLTWGDPSATDFVRGNLQDFCLLVTQRRNRADTGLTWSGDAAEQWTRFAQCFAGPPVDGPAPGQRPAL